MKNKLQLLPQKYNNHKRLLQTNKMDNLEEMHKFLEMYSLPRVNKEEIQNMIK